MAPTAAESLRDSGRDRVLCITTAARTRRAALLTNVTRSMTRLGVPRTAAPAALAAACLALLLPVAAPASIVPGAPAAKGALGNVPGEIIVKYAVDAGRGARVAAHRAAGVHAPETSGPRTRLVKVRPGQSTAQALRELRAREDVVYAARNPIARTTAYIPNDPGPSSSAQGWQLVQWNFLPGMGVNAPDAWSNLQAVGRPGGRGVVVAVIDSGVAYRDRGPYKRSPDLAASQFVRGYDFLGEDDRPHDASGHGTHVASTIAERTGNGVALTGLAYGARIMPIRVLDSQGFGDVDDIARGVRYAVRRGADVVNLSMEFDAGIRARHIPSLIEALRYADRRGVVVVAAAGNEGVAGVPYPARYRSVIAVGATTARGCVAEYSNYSSRIDLVAPGGGADSDLPDDPNCRPFEASGPDIYQLTFDGSLRRFGFPEGYQGTSMAAPHVSATAALVIASRVIGRDPSPTAVLRHLQRTARDLGAPGEDRYYGSGIIDAAAATRR